MKKLKVSQMVSISLMLFAIFFGAGNMIFPPAMGQQAGSNYLAALAGFILTDAGIATLGIVAIVFVGSSMTDLGKLVGKKFSLFLAIMVYLLIGPLFALPRTGSVSFELAVAPYVGGNTFIWSIVFTAVFFAITYYLSSNPNKIVDVVGKVLTPVLLVSIGAIFIATLIVPVAQGDFSFNVLQQPTGEYASIPLFKGMVEGYNALDGPAGLAFAIIVINAIKACGVKEKKDIAKYTVICGFGSAILLSLVYFALTYIGAVTGTPFDNGGALLHAVTSHLFGGVGGIVLGIAVLMACLTTSIGLTTSFADYFVIVKPEWGYKRIAAAVCFFSFVISNVGLSQLIKISLPILIMVYPATVVLCILSFFRKHIGKRKMVYILGMAFAFAISFVDGMNNAGIGLGMISDLVRSLPMDGLSLGWVLPCLVGCAIGYLPIFNKLFE